MRHLFRTLEFAMPATDRLPGTLGPYRLQDRLGEGGMGVVHLAHDPQGGLVAVKVLQPATTESANARLRLAREVETMRRVRSAFVAEVLDADVAGEFPYIVTRYVPGPTLEAMVRGRGPLSGPGLRRLAYGTAEALTAIHAAGVVHRDLKPGNVMLTDDRPVVIDFGIAQSPDATRLTQTGLVMGTPGYLAPEVIEGQPSSPASDVHSWGATMAYAATGRAPYGGGGDSYQTIFYRIVSGRADLSGVPAPLVPLVSAALARDPAHRPSAAWLSGQASALDLSAVGPAAAAAGPRPIAVLTGPAPGPNGAPPGPNGAVPGSKGAGHGSNGADRKSGRKGKQAKNAPGPAYPGPKQAARDVADLLPPVGYAPFPPPAAPANPGRPASASPGRPAPQAAQGPQWPPGPQAAAGPDGPPGRPAQPGRTTHAGLALMIAAVGLTLILPVAGLIVSLAAITLLRAADQAQSALAVRRSVRGPRPSDLLVVVGTAPLSVVRALLTEALMAPLALIVGAVVYVATLALTHSLELPRAGSYAAAAVVAWYGIGPGSGRPRRQLNRMASALARTPLTAAVTALAVWALAAGAIIFAASQAPYYWPVLNPHLPALHGWPFTGTHLPRLHSAPRLPRLGVPRLGGLLASARDWLFRHSHA
jgi:Protein kinase domain